MAVVAVTMSPPWTLRPVPPGWLWLYDAVVVSACWVTAYIVRFWLGRPRHGPAFSDYLAALPIIIAVYTVVFIAGGAYRPLLRARRREAWRLIGLPVVIATAAVYLLLRWRCPGGASYPRVALGHFAVLATVALGTSRVFLRSSAPFPSLARLRPATPIPVPPGALWVLDLVLFSLGWMAAYGLRFFVLASCAEPGHAPFADYVATLPEILALYSVAFLIMGAYRTPAVGAGVHDGAVTPLGHGRSATLLPAMIAAVILVIILRGGVPGAASSRAVILAFAVLAFASSSLVRTWFTAACPPTASIARRRPSAAAVIRPPRRAARRTALGVMIPLAVVLVWNLWWYGAYLSFPLFGEDGAANYSTLVETIRGMDGAFTFPIKWLEGLGQANVFVTVTFDPFSWIMLTGLSPEDAFRLGYALRATAAWLAAYAFAVQLFRGARAIAVSAATLTVIVAFLLSHPWGIPSFAGMFTATQMALFPGLLALYVARARDPRLVAWQDLAFVPALALFVLVYPIASLLPLAVMTLFGGVLVAAAPRSARPGALLALTRFVCVLAVILFAPVIGVFHAWSAVAAVSARSVFAAELTAYGQNLVLPHLWHDVPFGVRAVVVLALLAAALAHRWPYPLRAVVLTLAIAITVSQAAGVLRWLDVWPWLFNRLPRPFYIEFYLPVFYAIAAAYTLHRWAERRGRPARVSVLAGLVGLVVGVWGVLGTIAAFLGWRAYAPVRVARPRPLVPALGVIGVLAAAVLTWELAPHTLHPVFAPYLHCRARGLRCADAAGPSLGAGASPITEFLRKRLRGERFLGRAEFLLTPPLRLAAFSLVEGDAAAATAATVLQWYERAHRELRGGAAPPVAPATAVARLRELMWSNELPEDVVLGIREWAMSHPEYLRDVRLGSGWGHDAEITIMVQERDRNFAATGNGMLLRALPLQGVPVASSYEQSLDELYYLFWTRYVNAGATLRHSINFTTLYRLWPERLALIGVRYLVARDVPLRPSLDLPVVFRWHGYSVHEIADSNIAGWGVTRLAGAPTLADELRLMRGAGFNPRQTAVVAATNSELLAPREWAPLAESSIRLDGQSMLFTARSAGGRSLAVLPFKFSHCWREEWRGRPGRVVRVDTALLGVAFDGAADLRLTWSAGYGPLAQCLTRDAELTPQAKAAAAALE